MLVNNPSYPARFCSTFLLGISAKLKFFEREIVVHPVCSLYFTCNWIGIYVDNLVLSTHAVIKKGVRFTHNPSIASHPCSDVPIGSQHPCRLLSVFHDRAITGKTRSIITTTTSIYTVIGLPGNEGAAPCLRQVVLHWHYQPQIDPYCDSGWMSPVLAPGRGRLGPWPMPTGLAVMVFQHAGPEFAATRKQPATGDIALHYV